MSLGLVSVSSAFQPLPQGVKQGVAGQWQRQIYVGLGTAGAALYRLDLDAPEAGWQACAAFLGPLRENAASVMLGGSLYVFSGAGKADPEAETPVVLRDLYRYDTATDQWSALTAPCPIGFLGASAWALDERRFAVLGGYDKETFDRYVAQLARLEGAAREAHIVQFMSQEPQAYRWSRRLWSYDTVEGRWTDLGEHGRAVTGAALIKDAERLWVINGEIKPGLRRAEIESLTWSQDRPLWRRESSLPPLLGAQEPEGLSGAFAGVAQGVKVIAGGVNFDGARARAAGGHSFAHQGLTKTWRRDIYAALENTWHLVGHLDEGLAFGASFSLEEGLLLVGGEDAALGAHTQVRLLRWHPPS